MSEQSSTDSNSQRQLVLRAVLRTDVGLVRSENQDYGAFTTSREERGTQTRGRLLIVADGMGGHRGGATASRLAATTVKAQYLGAETSDMTVALRDALTRANSRIFHEAQANPDLRGMGTTTSVLAVRDGQGWIAHVGDSRVYLVRNDAIRQLTEDHSLVATMVREGLLTSQEAETHPRRNVLQRSMGVGESVEIDIVGPFDVAEGDTFVLCSDGLHGVVKEPEIREVAKRPIEEAAAEFVRLALERGAPDNVTVIVARAETGEEAEEPEDQLDETQPLEPIDLRELEASKPTEKLPPLTAEEIASAQGIQSSQPAGEEGAKQDGPEAGPGSDGSPRRHPFFKWVMVVALVLGAAGALVYSAHQPAADQRGVQPARTTSR